MPPQTSCFVGTGPQPDITHEDPNAGELTVHQQAGETDAHAEPRAAAAAESQQVSRAGLELGREAGGGQCRHGTGAWICTGVKDHCGMDLGLGTRLG